MEKWTYAATAKMCNRALQSLPLVPCHAELQPAGLRRLSMHFILLAEHCSHCHSFMSCRAAAGRPKQAACPSHLSAERCSRHDLLFVMIRVLFGHAGQQQAGLRRWSMWATSPGWCGARHSSPEPTTMSCVCAAGWSPWTPPTVSKAGRLAAQQGYACCMPQMLCTLHASNPLRAACLT